MLINTDLIFETAHDAFLQFYIKYSKLLKIK